MQINRRQAIGRAGLLLAAGHSVDAESHQIFTVRPSGSTPVDDAVRDALDQLLRVGGGTIYFPSGNHRAQV